MNEELRNETIKKKTISLGNDNLNDFLSGMVSKRLIWMFGSFSRDRILKLCEINLSLSAWIHD